ncbi:Response regulator receiver domain-containing protein [Rhizobium sp. NFR07]|jgi:CheY-like chemotaxis protein|uniref:response regulator n=1 Tax=Rhizobium sp. NFR07 TaxID=1566262 RepID=UPI0008E3F421|nr:response regulator [Rhizobium sp. NFR07]SFB50580.1 Response regulator receiver domain-containing protein [Rhizobium sp. NFR07]
MNNFRQKTVLVVEDEALIRFAVMDALEDAGYAVIEASSVLEAIGQLGQHEEIDLLITDVDMPGVLNGIDLARMVAECAPRISIIVSSARSVKEDLPASVYFLPKPCSAAGLLSTVGTMLKARGHADGEIRRQRA